jgi:twinkle protein
VRGTGDTPTRPTRRGSIVDLLVGEVVPLNKRGINQETCQKFGYMVGEYKGAKAQIAPYFRDGVMVAQKVRDASKNFKTLGDMKGVELFGQSLWRDGGKKVVVTEGEIDALTVSQLQQNKWPVVSIPNGSTGAKKALQNNLEWLERFELVVLLFDMDDPGKQAVAECAPLFSPGKCAVATLPLKDANEMLLAGRGAEVIDAIWGAKVFRPDGIVGIADLMGRLSAPIEFGLSWPWQGLTDATFGIRPGEMYTLGAGTGMGKSELWKEVMVHLGETHKVPVGGIFLEETPEHTVRCLAGKMVDKLYHIPGESWTQEQLMDTVGGMQVSGNYHLYDHFGHTDYDTIKARIRYMAVSLNCRHIFLDHITALVSGDKDGDERKQLDFIMTDLASLARELKFSLFMISHLATPEGKSHEEGGRVMLRHFRGSRAIGQWSNFVFGIERDQQGSDPKLKHMSTLRILKDRYTGRSTGKCLYLGYTPETGRLLEIEENPFDNQQEVQPHEGVPDF